MEPPFLVRKRRSSPTPSRSSLGHRFHPLSPPPSPYPSRPLAFYLAVSEIMKNRQGLLTCVGWSLQGCFSALPGCTSQRPGEMIGGIRSADTVDFRDAPARMLGVALHEYGSPHQFKVQLCALPREIKDHEVLIQVDPSSFSALDAVIRGRSSVALAPSPSLFCLYTILFSVTLFFCMYASQVQAASLNPTDAKIRSGSLQQLCPLSLPVILVVFPFPVSPRTAVSCGEKCELWQFARRP